MVIRLTECYWTKWTIDFNLGLIWAYIISRFSDMVLGIQIALTFWAQFCPSLSHFFVKDCPVPFVLINEVWFTNKQRLWIKCLHFQFWLSTGLMSTGRLSGGLMSTGRLSGGLLSTGRLSERILLTGRLSHWPIDFMGHCRLAYYLVRDYRLADCLVSNNRLAIYRLADCLFCKTGRIFVSDCPVSDCRVSYCRTSTLGRVQLEKAGFDLL